MRGWLDKPGVACKEGKGGSEGSGSGKKPAALQLAILKFMLAASAACVVAVVVVVVLKVGMS